jgi:hypothetical protein
LARLFAIAYRSLIDGLHDELAGRGWTDVRPAFGFVLLTCRDEQTTVTALADVLAEPDAGVLPPVRPTW